MTDNTQPEAMGLADWLEAVGGGPSAKRCAALLREQHTRIAELESELEAVGAGGVQALSAAPASPWSRALEIRMAQGWRLKGDRIPVLYTDTINGDGVGRDDLWLCTTEALAVSPTPPAEQQAITSESGAVYAELPDFDSGDEPIWEAVFKWKAANPGPDASKKAMAVESAIINSLRDFADRTHALRMEQAAPKAAPGEPYQDSTPHLSVGDSSFESWFSSYCPANKGDKQRARDAYAAGMGDPLVVAAPRQEVQEPYPIDADPQGIRAIVADAITGALAFGAQGSSPPPEGHWLTPFWEMAREEAMRTQPASVSSDTLYLLRRLLSNQHTLTGPEFRAELEKIVGEAYQQEAQEPIALLVRKNSWRAGQWETAPPDSPTYGLAWADHRQYVYAAPQPAPAPLSDDVSQKTWALIDELEKLRGADRYDEDWVTLNKRDDELRAALAAQKDAP